MTQDDHKAVFHILQLAEQGRFTAVVAQMIASLIHGGEFTAPDVLQLREQILEETLDLMLEPSEIWNGLLPGGPVDANARFALLDIEDVKDLEHLEQELVDLYKSHQNPGTPGRLAVQNAAGCLSKVMSRHFGERPTLDVKSADEDMPQTAILVAYSERSEEWLVYIVDSHDPDAFIGAHAKWDGRTFTTIHPIPEGYNFNLGPGTTVHIDFSDIDIIPAEEVADFLLHDD